MEKKIPKMRSLFPIFCNSQSDGIYIYWCHSFLRHCQLKYSNRFQGIQPEAFSVRKYRKPTNLALYGLDTSKHRNESTIIDRSMSLYDVFIRM